MAVQKRSGAAYRTRVGVRRVRPCTEKEGGEAGGKERGRAATSEVVEAASE